ncbi:MAG TPA: lipid A biosynthesis acyltransferase, partial [Burkholderiales bacterium]|nr:lipid A biosynthesis acyltransferase [Burkholderiales bacterium]
MSRVALALVWLAHFLPSRAIAALGSALGALAFWLIPERRRVTRINLEKCFPQMAPAARERIARDHFRAAGRSIFDLGLIWWAPRERVER